MSDDTLDMLKSVMDGMAAVELAVVGEHAARLMCDKGYVASFVQGAVQGAETSTRAAIERMANRGGSPRFWMKAVPKGSVDYSKHNGYAFNGSWLRGASGMAESSLVICGQGGEYMLAEYEAGMPGCTWHGKFLTGLRMLVESASGLEPIFKELQLRGV